MAYDPANGTIWTTNEAGGSETIIDAGTGASRGSVHLGGEARNVAYDQPSGRMLADVHPQPARLDQPGHPGDHPPRAAARMRP
jgi:hypothetical protein